MKVLDIQVSCPKMYTYRFDKNFVFDNIVKILLTNLSILITLPAEIIFSFFILIVVFTDFSSDNCTYHPLAIAFFSRRNSLKKKYIF